ncbi:hypothetical protein [Oricola thermophila]|uniref:Uncharacterized protein n=1 Tax=Oricola thermophila TaxID=2742145 RepID=A0A6N1VH92_9HYPH|nr:hypothetical protein [Oricola thermophila]QKV20271.1 hypothetical protein HTY61_18330 [Oricola thermophila]
MADKTTGAPDLKSAQIDLEEAIAAVEEAEIAKAEANRMACDRINRLNAAQKRFDEAVAAMRKRGARSGSDWQTAVDRQREAGLRVLQRDNGARR